MPRMSDIVNKQLAEVLSFIPTEIIPRLEETVQGSSRMPWRDPTPMHVGSEGIKPGSRANLIFRAGVMEA